MKQELAQVKALSADVLRCMLASVPEDNGTFRLVSSMTSDPLSKSVLLVGSTHRAFDDGYCIAILNPDEKLLEKINPGVGYTSKILQEIVRGHCDAALTSRLAGGKVHQTWAYRARLQ